MYVGGLRARLIRESLYQMIHSSLDALGWFDPNRQHLPVQFIAAPIMDETAIPVNTAALGDLLSRDFDDELGSLMAEHRWTLYVDFFGESNALSIHFSRDVKDILGGRIGSIGRIDPSLKVYDYTQATPTEIFTCEIEDIIIDGPNFIGRQNKTLWYTVRFDIVDYYGTEDY